MTHYYEPQAQIVKPKYVYMSNGYLL
jgi:hypothetical protein